MASTPSKKERMAAIAAYRAQLDKKIRYKERRIALAYEELTTPSEKPLGSISSLISRAGTFATIADGVLMGYRVVNQFRKYFR